MNTVDWVKSFVGCDAHSLSCSLKSYGPRGKVNFAVDVPTTIEALQEPLKKLKHPVWFMVESCPMAAFVTDAVGPLVDRIIVCDTRENHWIS